MDKNRSHYKVIRAQSCLSLSVDEIILDHISLSLIPRPRPPHSHDDSAIILTITLFYYDNDPHFDDLHSDDSRDAQDLPPMTRKRVISSFRKYECLIEIIEILDFFS